MSRLLQLSVDSNFCLYRKPVKMNLSFDGLAALVRKELNRDIIHGDVYIFLNKQRSTIKIYVYENKGFSVFHRRLDEGSFQLPLIASDHLSYKMTVEQMEHMLSGVTLTEEGYLSKEKYVPLHGSM